MVIEKLTYHSVLVLVQDYINLAFRMILILFLSSHNTEVCHLQHGYMNRSAGIFKDIGRNEKEENNHLL